MPWVQQNSKRADGVLPLVTDAAAQQVFDVLLGRNIPDDVAIRLYFIEGSLTFEVSQMRTDDMMFVHQDRVVLLVDARTALSLAAHTIDNRPTDEGPQLVLRAPEETENR